MFAILKTLKVRLHGRKLILFVLLCFILFLAVLNVMNAACLKLLFDIATRESKIPLWMGISLPLVVVILTAVFNILLNYFKNKVIMNISEDIKSEMLEHIERIPLLKYNSFHSGDFLTRISDDADNAAKIIPESMLNIISGITSSLFALIYTFYLSWKMTLIVIVLSPLVLIWSNLIIPHIQKHAIQAQRAESENRGFIQEQLANVVTIKCFSLYKSSVEHFKVIFQKRIDSNLKMVLLNSVLQCGGTVVGFLSFVFSVSYGSYLVLQHEATVGTVIGFTQMLNFIIWPFTEMMSQIGSLQSNIASLKRLQEIMEIPEETVSQNNNKTPENNYKLIFYNVSFRYNEDRPVLKNINVEFDKNQVIGIVGQSGCGKSTFLKLALSLYEPDAGEIYVQNGSRKISGTLVRDLISYVPQDHVLFSGTIEDNIRYGKPNATESQIREAARKANIHDVICKLPEGYKTIVEEGGRNLSFGQAQRIAVARALIRETPIIIMDEPTASLDADSENLILQTLKQESNNRICIIVSHNTNIHDKYDRMLCFKDHCMYDELIPGKQLLSSSVH